MIYLHIKTHRVLVLLKIQKMLDFNNLKSNYLQNISIPLL